MDLKLLSDQELLERTAQRVQKERESLTDLLRHFQEISRRRLYSDQRCESMYAFLEKIYHYPPDQAYRRVTAMRMLQELPEVEQELNSGALSLSSILAVHAHIRREEEHNQQKMPREEKLDVVSKICQKSVKEATSILVAMASAPEAPKPDKVRALPDEKFEFKLTGSRKVLEMIEQLKGRLAHQNPDLSMGELFEKLCELGLECWNPAETKTSAKRKASAASQPSSSNPATDATCSTKKLSATSRTEKSEARAEKPESQAAIRRKIFKHAGNKCEQCGSHYAIEEDHVTPRAKGGSSKADNLRVLCRSCNQRAAIIEFGQATMDPFINPWPH